MDHAAENLRDFDSTLSELYKIGLALTESLDDVDVVLHKVAESAQHLLKADIAVCYAYDQDANTYQLSADVGAKLEPKMGRNPRSGGPTAKIVANKKPLIVQNAQTEDTPFLSSPFTQNEGVKSVIGYPLMTTDTEGEKEVVGVLYVNYREADRITQDVERVAGLLANQAAVAIFNARLIGRLKEREEDTTRLVDIVRKVSEAIANSNSPATKSPTVKLVLDEIARTACQLVSADCAVIYPWDQSRAEYFETEHIGVHGLERPMNPSDRPRSKDGMAAYVKREGKIWIDDVKKDPRMLNSPFISREGIEAFAGVSVQVDGGYLGVLYVDYRCVHRFSENEKRIIAMFADQVGVALQIARLLEEEQRSRSNLEMLGILHQIGGVFAHRLANEAGSVPLAVQEIRRRLNQLDIKDAMTEDWLTQIETAIAYLEAMAVQLRKLKGFRETPEPVDINTTLSDIIQQYTAHKGHILLKREFDAHIPTVLVQRTPVQEMFINCISNAVDVMPDGGSLTIETRLLTRSSGDAIEVAISDTGPGIDKERHEWIFQPFKGKNRTGIGFGLWYARTFLRSIGGEVLLKSEVGKGSTFSFVIPVLNQER